MPKTPIARVILIRHGESIWNITDPARNLILRFTGWADVCLTSIGRAQAAAAGRCLKRFGIVPNVVYTSLLQRSKTTLDIALDAAGLSPDTMTIVNSWRLNERHYGGLVGLSKVEAINLMGKELVMGWRRSWDLCPPPVDPSDQLDWRNLITVKPTTIVHSKGSYSANIEKDVEIPNTESLEDCAKRAVVLWNSSIAPRLLLGQTVMVVAHANTIRALVKMIDGDCMSLKDIQEVLIPSAVPLVYQFNKHLVPVLEPTVLGMRGRYLLTKELISLSQVLHRRETVTEFKREIFLSRSSATIGKFEEVVELGYDKTIAFCNAGLGRHVPIAVSNYQGKFVFVNSMWCRVTGFSSEDVIGKSWKVNHGPMTTQQSVSEINSRLHSGLATNSSMICYNKDGKAFEYNMSIIPIYDWLHSTCPSADDPEPVTSESDFNIAHMRQHLIPSHYVNIVKSITHRPDISPIGGTFSPIKVEEKYMKYYDKPREDELETAMESWVKDYENAKG